jgi:Zn-finger nucleic acid-binding protein
MLKNFKRGFNRDYGVKLTPDKLRTFCEIDQPTFGGGWLSKGSLDKVIVNRVFEVVVGEPETPR